MTKSDARAQEEGDNENEENREVRSGGVEEWRSGGYVERSKGVTKQSVNIKLTEIFQPSKTTFQLLAKLHRSIQQLSIPAFLPNSTTACTGEDKEGDYNCTLAFQLGTTHTFVS